ncbi:hypothetical protein E4P40_09990 [Blastococcus sp. CT_GayMR20]|uniref:hypothetical protein n=1 Tax=Blastococcus sp. CT_GayMR20 TaxID=2559609 RepID=UPI0010745397|nr:hypothetical protein [Blastococcus sp. CT_GayMR20]TFV88388.1 hypothetical protein E4P40_09990 [Blastococcus sp. CT_GayMR20]
MFVFALMPVLSTLSNLVLLPTISSTFGQAGWTSVVLGQGIGAAVSVVCSLQWPTEGPALVARAPSPLAQAMLRASMRSRLVALVACLPFAVALIVIVDPPELLVCVLSCLATAAIGMSPMWYAVGIGRPSILIWLEGIPRLVGNLLSFGLILGGALLWTYPAVMLAVSVFTAVVSWFLLAGGIRGNGQVWRNEQNRRSVSFATLARSLDAGYNFILGPVVALLAPAAYPVFGACDRLGKVVISGLSIVPQGAAGWAAEPHDESVRIRRVRLARAWIMPVALLLFVFLTFATPTLVHLLFAGTVEVSLSTSALLAGVVCMAFLAQFLFLTGLAPTGHATAGYRYLVIGFAVGLPSLVVGTLLWGANGAFLGVLTAGALLVGLSLWRIRTAIRQVSVAAA